MIKYSDEKKAVNKMYIRDCMYPKCQDKAIHSHSLQNNRVISELAVKNHVLMPMLQNNALFLEKDKRFNKELKLVGKNEATTFDGFCPVHDNKIFLPIEKNTLNLTEMGKFLYAYRNVCFHLRSLEELLKRLINSPYENEKSFLITYYFVQALLKIKEVYLDKYIISKGQLKCPIDSLCWHFKNKANFAANAIMFPVYGFNGELYMKTNAYENGYPLIVTSFPNNNETIVLVSWLKHDKDKLKGYIKKLKSLSRSEKELYITNFILGTSSDIIFSPKIKEQLDPKTYLIEGGLLSLQEKYEQTHENCKEMLEYLGINLFKL